MSRALGGVRDILRQMTPADGVVAVGLIVLSGALAASARWPPGSSSQAAVSVGRHVVVTLPLDRDAEQTVRGRLGPVRLEVADGAIRVTESGCSQQLCVGMGARRRAGEMIACVPNALVVRLVGTPDEGTPDAVTR